MSPAKGNDKPAAAQEPFLARVLVPESPSRLRFAIVAVLLVLWISLLLWMYFSGSRPLPPEPDRLSRATFPGIVDL